MALTIRHYIFQDDGILKRIPRRIFDALPFGNDAIPEYANTRQRHAEELVENEDCKPGCVYLLSGGPAGTSASTAK